MRTVLLLAAAYNFAWGTLAVLFPQATYSLAGLDTPPGAPLANAELWQWIGMILGVFGVGYAVASRDPLRHWPIVLIGFLSKLLGVLSALGGVLSGRLAAGTLVANFFNDVIWLVPFALILRRAAVAARAAANEPPGEPLAQLLDESKDQDGRSLAALSAAGPVLVVFLRHFG
jgi:hypothetical protein